MYIYIHMYHRHMCIYHVSLNISTIIYQIYTQVGMICEPAAQHRQGATYVSAFRSWTIAPHTLALKAYVHCEIKRRHM